MDAHQESTRKSASRLVLDIIDSPRRALANRKKRLNAEKLKGKQVNLPACIDPNSSAFDMDIEADADASSSHAYATVAMEVERRSISVLDWLEQDAPQDILPKILSFAGPQKVLALSKVNRTWNHLCESEAVFRTLCEDFGKWVEGEHAGPGEDDNIQFGFWRQFYCDNPMVPLDYRTLHKAAAATCRTGYLDTADYIECDRDIRILVAPGLYILDREVLVETMGDATFTIETHAGRNPRGMDFDVNMSSSSARSPSRSGREDGSPALSRRRLNSGLRGILTCRSSSADDESEHGPCISGSFSRDQATFVLKTKKKNCPLFHIRQGHMRLSKVTLIHNCSGTDIWNGNTAVQIQPRFDDRFHPTIPLAPNKPPTATIEGSKIMSISGRGIVAIDGSAAIIKNSHIHRCAATGIYIGGPGSVANITNSDIMHNGIGNKRARRGIARGHSGVYLEQGAATLTNCNISQNTLTGISAVSPTNAFLMVQDSDLIGNGTQQLEMPPNGSISRSKSSSVNNTIADEGTVRSRSGLSVEEDEHESPNSSESERSV